MIQDYIPSVLQHNRGSISTYRALKQIQELMKLIDSTCTTEYEEDMINASLDDIETMLESIK